MTARYPGYDVLAKWDGPSFNDVTRAVIAERLHDVPERRFFDVTEFALLEAVCDRLLPQPDRTDPVPIAPFVDAQIADGIGEGFRRPGMPLPGDVWRRALAGNETTARQRFGQGFTALAAVDRDSVLTAVQTGDVDRAAFAGLDPDHVFSAIILKTVAGIYYSHPAAWSEIGFGGPASPRGYVRLGLDRRDPWEAPMAVR